MSKPTFSADYDMQRDSLSEALTDGHYRLDEAGVPNADGVICNDPECQSKIGHRIHMLADERDQLRTDLEEALEEWHDYAMNTMEYLREKHQDIERIEVIRKRHGLQ